MKVGSHLGIDQHGSAFIHGVEHFYHMLSLALRISDAVYFAGRAEKLLFGTDYPVETHEDGLALVSMLKVTQADKEKILWRNASRLYSI